MKKFNAIIFDMDGTIIDTETIWKKATQQLLETRGVRYTPELAYELDTYLRGLALHKSCKILKDIAQLDDHVEHLVQEKATLANSLYEKGVQYIEGFVNFHRQVRKHELATAIATNATPCTVKIARRVLGLEDHFGKHIYDISHVNYICKPDPAIYQFAAQQLGVDPTECIAIEDSAHGAQAAKAAGMMCIGINTAKDATQLQKTDLIIDYYHQLDLPTLIYHPKKEEPAVDHKKPKFH